jgi:Mlc titration factor MtfA (ptsG expression regulator)
MSEIIFIISLVIIAGFLYPMFRKRAKLLLPDQQVQQKLLSKHVVFYQRLQEAEKKRFLENIKSFLQTTRITGVKTPVEDLDRVFVAAAAIIPIFGFKGWSYRNIHEVLLYPGSFDNAYRQEGDGRNIMGMVGTGPLQNVMILSRPDLREGFLNREDKSNTAIHEFVHLIDKTDGSTDGIPEILLKNKYVIPWLKRIREEIEQINKGRSDINPYGATNEAEFFAVAAEYFFEQPGMMKEKHPELYDLLELVFAGKVES